MSNGKFRRRRAALALLVIGLAVILAATVTVGRSLNTGPLQAAGDRVLKPGRDLVDWVDKTFDARSENGQLRSQLEVVRRQAVSGEVATAENAELRKLMSLDRGREISTSYTLVTGRVIARPPASWLTTVTVDLGSSDGVRRNDPVINGDGLVGRIIAARHGTAKVALITDPSSAVSAKVVPARVQGLVQSEPGKPGQLALDFINSNKYLRNGEEVVTSGWRAEGLASHFPPDIPIGEVVHASIIEQDASGRQQIRHYADLPNLDLVQVLTGGWRR